MAHYAFIDENNIVLEVITGRNENEIVDGISDWEKYYGDLRGMKCLRTSYNGNIRKNFAGIGCQYDPVRDEFIRLRQYASWHLDENNDWQPPTPKPKDQPMLWDEINQCWQDKLTYETIVS
jgi:hypothetical protein